MSHDSQISVDLGLYCMVQDNITKISVVCVYSIVWCIRAPGLLAHTLVWHMLSSCDYILILLSACKFKVQADPAPTMHVHISASPVYKEIDPYHLESIVSACVYLPDYMVLYIVPSKQTMSYLQDPKP